MPSVPSHSNSPWADSSASIGWGAESHSRARKLLREQTGVIEVICYSSTQSIATELALLTASCIDAHFPSSNAEVQEWKKSKKASSSADWSGTDSYTGSHLLLDFLCPSQSTLSVIFEMSFLPHLNFLWNPTVLVRPDQAACNSSYSGG